MVHASSEEIAGSVLLVGLESKLDFIVTFLLESRSLTLQRYVRTLAAPGGSG
jgi:hypothetical protein